MFTDELITQVRNLAQVPDTDEDITDEFILTQAYLGLLERFTHPIIMQRNGSWLHSYTFETTAGVSRYRIPHRSIVQGLEKIECAVGQGSGNSNSSGWYLLNVQTNIQATDYEGQNYMGRPRAFTYAADSVEVFPTPTANWTLRIWYYLRPCTLLTFEQSELQHSGIGSIEQYFSGEDQYLLTTSNGVLSGYAALGISLDVQFGNGNNEYVAVNAPMLPAGPLAIIATLTPNEADLMARSLANQGNSLWGFGADSSTFLIPLPQELANALVSYVGAVVLAEKGDAEKAQVFSQKAELAIRNVTDIAIPRAKGMPNFFKPHSSYLRRRIGRWGQGGLW
jgi:hypothetical protein